VPGKFKVQVNAWLLEDFDSAAQPIGRIQFRHCLRDMQNRATEAIHRPNEKDTEPAAHGILEHQIECWPLATALAAADPLILIFLDDLKATMLRQ
jgi:hypothetical protein